MKAFSSIPETRHKVDWPRDQANTLVEAFQFGSGGSGKLFISVHGEFEECRP